MRYLSGLLVCFLCVAFLFLAGCSQTVQSGTRVQTTIQTGEPTPSPVVSPAVQETPVLQPYIVAVTVQKSGKNVILTYQGGLDTDKLLHCTVSVNGIEQAEKLGNVPGNTITLEGAASPSNDHVVVTGYFNDGSSQTVLDLDTNVPDTSGGIYYRPLPPIRTIYVPSLPPVKTPPLPYMPH